MSESRRASSSAEQRYRINEPNSKPRTIRVVAMDASAAELVDRLSQRTWPNTTFLTTLPTAATGDSGSLKHWLTGVLSETKELSDNIKGTDLVVLIAGSGSQVDAAIPIGEVCAAHGVPVVGLVIRGGPDVDDASRQTVKTFRQATTMLVVAGEDDYVEEMLMALRA